MTKIEKFFKRVFDLLLSSILFITFLPLMFVCFLLASFDTRSFGIFIQKRVGMHGKIFHIFKIRTMRKIGGLNTTVSTFSDKRITTLGSFFRRTKLDELPQLLNIILGDMSFVGPRPDVPGFADKLVGYQAKVLSVRPGVTGPASLKYRHEEVLLAGMDNPEKYNLEIVWPDKVAINLDYIKNYSFFTDLKYILQTVHR